MSTVKLTPDYLESRAADLSDESNQLLASLEHIHRILAELDDLNIGELQSKIHKIREKEGDFRKYVDNLQEIEYMLIEIINMFPPTPPFSPIIKL